MIGTLILMLVASALTAAYFIVSRRQRMPTPQLTATTLPDIRDGLPMIAGLTGGVLCSGNRVEVFQNGEFIEIMKETIREARESVHFETFVWNAGELEHQFVDLLRGKAGEGLKVRVIIDYVGAKKAGESQLSALRKSGIELSVYRSVTWLALRRFNNRMHRKLLIVDGEQGFVFGHGISDEWRGNAEDKHHWRDTGIRLRGPAVSMLQSVFTRDWIDASRQVPREKECFPTLKSDGATVAHVATSQAGDVHSSVALLYMLAIASARREIIIQNPYFTPDPSIPKLLERMARNGVDVSLMVPGEYTDSPFVRRAGQRLYRSLLEAGVRVYEFTPSLLHQKIVIIDGVWSHIGSTNFDERSLALNSEIGLGLLDEDIAAQLRAAFLEDLKRSRELTLNEWRQRPWYERLKDWGAYQLHSQI